MSFSGLYKLRSLGFRANRSGGFSILEVLITAAIIGIITAIVTIRYGSFNNLILLKNQAYQIALELREVQTRSLSVRGESNQFRSSYGLYFARSQPTQYIIFLDSNNNGLYNSGEALEVRNLDSRFLVTTLCGNSNCALNALSVVFKRPNFDAIINNGAYSTARIDIKPINSNNTRSIDVNAAGQIDVD